ncbi:helix-turn-helix domain-containing protein [Brevibacterium sp. FAM 25378]|uniref:helix-turn-helix domain-containing protein n=1 Tax=Brevibacterium sp. FAM 25378 TaxID=3415682 RepID=UPI003C7B98CC
MPRYRPRYGGVRGINWYLRPRTQIPSEVLTAAVPTGLSEPGKRENVGDSLLTTLETLLSCGGKVKVTSEQLYIQRTGFYYRLRRVQAVAGLDLNRGDDQLIAHPSLKIIRLTEDD